ncbi:MAG: hypothetical protein ACYTBS_22810 [Planctomycetota bacterium]|jgi:hypothetical protein
MAARKRKKKGKTGAISSLLSVLKRKRKKRTSWVGPGLRAIVKVLAVVCLLSGAALGLLFLEEYVKDAAGMSQDAFYLELADVPAWVDAGLKNEVKEIANSGGVDVRSDDDAALAVRRNIEKQVAWLDDVTVRVKQDVLRVEGRWRKPVALIRTDLVEPRYVDSELVVLDYVPLPELPVVEVVGLAETIDMPEPGRIWLCDDLAAATKILDRMNQMDKSFASERPLLFEIDRIDVRNFNGRRDEGDPHIVMYTKDDIQIIWGADWGKWQQHLESTDQEKLAKLWGYYRQHGTLSVGVKYINLRDPQDKIPLPIDKY